MNILEYKLPIVQAIEKNFQEKQEKKLKKNTNNSLKVILEI